MLLPIPPPEEIPRLKTTLEEKKPLPEGKHIFSANGWLTVKGPEKHHWAHYRIADIKRIVRTGHMESIIRVDGKHFKVPLPHDEVLAACINVKD